MKLSTKEKILNYLANNQTYNTLTVRQAQARFGVKNVPARIHELRQEGLSIYTNSKVLSDGRKITFYRFGKPSDRFVRNFGAGRDKLAIKSLYAAAV